MSSAVFKSLDIWPQIMLCVDGMTQLLKQSNPHFTITQVEDETGQSYSRPVLNVGLIHDRFLQTEVRLDCK